MATNLSGLNNFQKRIKKLSNAINNGNLISTVAEKGVQIANDKYSVAEFGTNPTTITCTSTVISPTKARISAKGDRISYLEYGTGFYAQGSYPADKLPSWWQYYYPSEFKVTKFYGGEELKGWNNTEYGFCTGQKAGAQMYHTSVELRKQIPNIVEYLLRR